jgi:hypothetical protein
MLLGDRGNLGKSGNVECVTCGLHYSGDGSNPPSPLSKPALGKGFKKIVAFFVAFLRHI